MMCGGGVEPTGAAILDLSHWPARPPPHPPFLIRWDPPTLLQTVGSSCVSDETSQDQDEAARSSAEAHRFTDTKQESQRWQQCLKRSDAWRLGEVGEGDEAVRLPGCQSG